MQHDNICLWKDLYYLSFGVLKGTTFSDCNKWNDNHPLYKCLDCSGYDTLCIGYKSLRSINRKRHEKIQTTL